MTHHHHGIIIYHLSPDWRSFYIHIRNITNEIIKIHLRINTIFAVAIPIFDMDKYPFKCILIVTYFLSLQFSPLRLNICHIKQEAIQFTIHHKKAVWIWPATPYHLIAGHLELGRDGLVAITINSYLFD